MPPRVPAPSESSFVPYVLRGPKDRARLRARLVGLVGLVGMALLGVGCAKKPALVRGLDEGPDGPSSHRIRTLVAGHGHVCALYNSGSVACWGKGAELALGTSLAPRTAKAIAGVHQARRLGVGRCDACALDAEGALTCWGFAGDACRESSPPLLAVPTRMTNVPPLRSLQASAFDETLCGIAEDGTHHCVMAECPMHELFARPSSSLYEPCKRPRVTTFAGETTGFWRTRDHVDTSELAFVDATCARAADGLVRCDSHVTCGLDPIPELDAPSERVTRMSGVFHDICFVLESGKVECRSSDGITVPDLPGPARTAAATLGRGCATGRDGTLSCWTTNVFPSGQGGTRLAAIDYEDTSAHARVVVTDVDGFCSLDDADVVRCWQVPRTMSRIELP